MMSDRIIVVSGIPRSGTSMLMQILAAGGVPIFGSMFREQDVMNPRGFYEAREVRDWYRGTDDEWVESAVCHAVKVIAPYVRRLPSTYHYDVIMMHRPSEEIALSQVTAACPVPTQEAVRHQLAYVAEAQHWTTDEFPASMRVHHMYHGDVLARPHVAAAQLAAFLRVYLNQEAMAAAVDPTLYRSRCATDEQVYAIT
jgi:hypothetical protein